MSNTKVRNDNSLLGNITKLFQLQKLCSIEGNLRTVMDGENLVGGGGLTIFIGHIPACDRGDLGKSQGT
jgi:hypothetical protein